MKRTFARIPVLLLSAAMILSLCSCGGKGITTEDASKCVQVEMDATYKGQFQGMVDFYENVTTEIAREQYNDNVEGEAYYFLYSFGPEAIDGSGDMVEPTDMQLHQAKESRCQLGNHRGQGHPRHPHMKPGHKPYVQDNVQHGSDA